MSHFTRIQTKMSEEDLLVKSLDDLKMNWRRKKILLNQFNNEKHFCDIILKERNSNRIGFLKKDNSYKLIYDEMLWDLNITVHLFHQKINTYYTLNLINKNLSTNGFQIKSLVKEKTYENIKIKLNALRFT